MNRKIYERTENGTTTRVSVREALAEVNRAMMDGKRDVRRMSSGRGRHSIDYKDGRSVRLVEIDAPAAAPVADQPRETYQAAFNPGEQEVTAIRNIRAGISGPCGEYPAETLEDAERALFDAGYLITSPWGDPTGNGSRWCSLTRMD
jgi:hypothetical protein